MELNAAISSLPSPRPILKWTGGKQQLLPILLSKTPKKFNRYIKPFLGGGALFFALQPDKSIVSDSNPEIINLYRVVADNIEPLTKQLDSYKTDEKAYYYIRALNFNQLSPTKAAARTLYLNKLCFNGLYLRDTH